MDIITLEQLDSLMLRAAPWYNYDAIPTAKPGTIAYKLFHQRKFLKCSTMIDVDRRSVSLYPLNGPFAYDYSYTGQVYYARIVVYSRYTARLYGHRLGAVKSIDELLSDEDRVYKTMDGSINDVRPMQIRLSAILS